MAYIILLFAASLAFAQTPAHDVGHITIYVYDYANLSPDLLASAEEAAKRVFLHAGVETVWESCLPKLQKQLDGSCYTIDSSHFMLKILPNAISGQAHDRNDVLGTALVDQHGVGYFAYVFYDNVGTQAKDRRLGYMLLADVLCHEIGHLLLGSNSHSVSGIMSAHWYGEEMRKISQAGMLFTPRQCRMMRSRLGHQVTDIPVQSVLPTGH